MQNSVRAKIYALGDVHTPLQNCSFKLWKSYHRPDPSQTYYALDVPVGHSRIKIPLEIREQQEIYNRDDLPFPCNANITPKFTSVDLMLVCRSKTPLY
jgi:hypothetical protein